MKTRAVSFGKFVVGKLDAADPSGDVAMRAGNICGEAMTLWKSVAPGPRNYEKTTQLFQSDQSDGSGIAGKFIDSNANGQPDYIDVLGSNTQEYYTAGGPDYDAAKYGLLLFRETVDPLNGTVNSGNIEVARLIANGDKNHLQRSAEPGDGDATVTASSDAVNASYDASTKTLKAGSQSGTGGSLPVCGTNGYVTVIAPQVIGWKQVADVPNGKLDIYFGPGKHSNDGGKTSVDCGMTFSSSSKPTWAGGRVVGEGWKIVTKHTYNAYAMAAKTADYRDSESNVPDDYDQRGKDLFSYDFGTNTVSLDGLTSGNVETIEAGIDEIVAGLGCGFGGGACISMPFNWAPLAPGSSPTVMGFPASSLVPSTGFPVFSALTGMPVGPFCIPSVWPASPLDLGRYCTDIGAGGYLGDKGAANFFRFYITPTLTGAVGIAACFGVVPAVMGRVPPQGVSPVVPGGNCIVAAKPLLGCKDDGSDGDVSSQGMANADGFFNANSCKPKTNLRPLMNTERQLIRSYVRGDRSKTVVNGITAALPYVTSGPKGFGSSPVIGIGMSSGQDPNFEVGINSDALKNFDFGNILKINLSRTSAFPEFIMDWVNRQTEEVVNKLTSLPTLYIILPDFSKIYESGWNGFADKLKGKYDKGVTDYGKDRDFQVGTSKYAAGASNQANSLLADNKDNINTVGKNISGLRTAYEFLSSLPIIQFENEMVRVDVPMISDEDVDKAILDFNKTKAQWTKEISDKKQAWSKLGSKDGVNEKIFVEADATVASIDAWARFLEDAKRFPDKLYRYMTWKQRYAEQILCNVESIEQMTGGYIAENGKRFRAWVELYVMLKAIMKSWQLMVDLFYQHTADCGVCRNERYDLKHFIFKIISAVIPKIPIIKFPKWPDIVLDLHNIRLGLRILMPEFEFHVSPFVLPHLPRLALPNVPGLGIGLPTIPAPPTFPKLPDLPDLPSLPSIKLPDLPPPPKIPKLFAAIQGVLQILKLVSKILCILRKNPFVPEWRAGDQIAQITERQGKMPFDFFNIEFPNFSLAFVDAIRVTTFVNVEFQVDFILEMAKSTFQPINEFSTDLRSSVSGAGKEVGLPSKIDMTDTVPQGDTRIDVKGPQGMKVPDVSKMSTAERKALMTNFAWTIALSFREFVAYLDREKGNEVALAEFKKLVASEASKLVGSDDRLVAGIADVLARAAHYDASEERALTDSLLSDNKEKFGIVKDSIRAEIEETKAMKAKIEKFQREKNSAGNLLSALGKNASDAVFAATFQNVGTSFGERGKALEKFEAKSAEKFERLASKEDAKPTELEAMGADVVGQVKAMTDDALRKEKSLASTTPNPLTLLGGIDDASGADGLLENGQPFRFDIDEEQMKLAASSADEASSAMNLQFVYQGIYVKDEGKQSRLFDYVEELQGNEEALLVDTAKAGAGKEDVVYAMGSSLYLKRNLKSDVASHSTDRVRSYDMDDILADGRDPSAPNYFKEDFVSSNQINFSFDPAKTTDRKFRLEFYDYVDRFDRIARGESAPVTPKRAVDLFADMRDDTVVDASATGMVVRKNVAYFDSASGEGEITYPGYRILTAGDVIGVAGGRTVHTDGGGAKIRFAASGQELANGGVVDVPRYGNVEFLATGNFEVESGNVYLFDSNPQAKTVDLSEIRGLPALANTKIVLSKPASRITVGYHDGSEFGLRGPAQYDAVDLGKPAPKYSVSVSQSNDWYYSKLYAFGEKQAGAQASLTLLSPQIQADKEGPLNGFPTNYRIPVYVRETVGLKKYVSDVSGVSDVYVDVDPASDRNGDKVNDNDRDSDSASTGSGIVKGSDWSELVIGPFQAPGAFTARMVATDANGNKTFRDVTFTAYVPTPKIVAASTAQANGSIDAQYAGEPIDLFRYRGGKLSRLSGTGETLTDAVGNFARTFSGGTGVALTHSGKTVATVDEKTGRIELKDSSYSVAVRAAGTVEPMTVAVRDKNGADVYFESFALPATTKIDDVARFSEADETGVFVRMEEGIDFVRNAQDAKSLPGGAFLVNENRKAFAGIGRDGNVYLLESGYSLSYRNESGYPVIVVKNSFGVVVAEILFRLDAEYVIK